MTLHRTTPRRPTSRSAPSPAWPIRARLATAAAAAGLLIASCGDDEPAAEDVDPPAVHDEGHDEDQDTATETGETTEPAEGATETDPPEDTTDDETDAAHQTGAPEDGDDDQTSAEDLPGQVFEMAPREGDELLVVSVPAGETLGVYGLPGGAEEITRVEPGEVTPVATGHNRTLDEGIWVEADVAGELGWISFEHVAFAGAVRDESENVPDTEPASSLQELGVRAGEQIAAGGPTPTITVVEESGEDTVVVDVVGIGDDSVIGYRLTITAQVDGDSYVLDSVEGMTLCGRGVSPEGLCV